MRHPITKLRRWKQGDAAWIRQLDNESFPGCWSYLNDERHHWWVVGRDAYAALKRVGKVAYFTRCAVRKSRRGHGIQKQLIEVRLRWCRRMGIRVVHTHTEIRNKKSTGNLLRAGFTRRISKDGKWLTFRKDLR